VKVIQEYQVRLLCVMAEKNQKVFGCKYSRGSVEIKNGAKDSEDKFSK